MPMSAWSGPWPPLAGSCPTALPLCGRRRWPPPLLPSCPTASPPLPRTPPEPRVAVPFPGRRRPRDDAPPEQETAAGPLTLTSALHCTPVPPCLSPPPGIPLSSRSASCPTTRRPPQPRRDARRPQTPHPTAQCLATPSLSARPQKPSSSASCTLHRRRRGRRPVATIRDTSPLHHTVRSQRPTPQAPIKAHPSLPWSTTPPPSPSSSSPLSPLLPSHLNRRRQARPSRAASIQNSLALDPLRQIKPTPRPSRASR